ncbi:hypothetical protein GALMADRAFT_629969 [Galerina marginata CBS 339.88]|uniref:Uncharacterized protein n=1 Tax=Galerina marginata (strain CBS 339.88) TaxID=685588 RepID=A0A067SRY5_GALM3|nr:hypothetical protein GALMADRAFT_629969 [Galerina marginata CBS 339.88]
MYMGVPQYRVSFPILRYPLTIHHPAALRRPSSSVLCTDMTFSPQHLGVAWEAAVVSAFVVVFIAVVVVVAFQIRRRQRQLNDTEAQGAASRSASRSGKRKGKKTEVKAEIEINDLEKGESDVVPEGYDERDLETESEDEGIADVEAKRKRSRSSYKSRSRARSQTASKTKPKLIGPDKPRSSKDAADPSSEDYYFEHPSQKPPKYYWDHR